jgi:ubiquinone/menaquinone biosynthesis C-methylase UbiE
MNNGSWEKIYSEQGEVQHEILNTVVEAVSLFRNKKYLHILDLGCGTGRNAFYLAHNGFKVTACDISETGIIIAKKKAEELGFNDIDFDIEDMFDLNYPDGTFDAVLCVWTQGHGLRSDIQKSINEIHRILKPGGMTVSDFVTIDDPTFGVGEKIADNTFIGGRPGEENIPHWYAVKEELQNMFLDFSNVKFIDRTYRFKDNFDKEHTIKTIVVQAEK